ncbi:ATP-dependent helicase [Campylobacter sp. RM12642]|uniref:ATP-dependent helicase n=1 Tax=Campylobacter sp. RM12642 TaxID=2735736 RepID=UPI003014DEDC|nr:ATP-dependent helicase [Campylobacter sp. RM12642]
MNYLDRLNPAQKQAATFVDGSLLILAGAGTGKTQTMISRLVYLISEVGISPESILSLTFTNKAAASMKERAIKMLNEIGYSNNLPILSTFHSFGMEFLSEYIELLDGRRKKNYRLIDTDDKKAMIKEFVLEKIRKTDINFLSKDKKDKEILKDEKEFLRNKTNEAMAYIDRVKNTLEFELENENHEIYLDYEKALEYNNLIDFDDLIILPHDILKNNPTTATKISNQYSYIMVDEYQDTNLAQLKLLKLLCKAHQNIVVVGDDDQSIYSFRHARIQNILGFSDDFQDAKIIKLEENYRSTKTILNHANSLIANNKTRYGKELFTNNEFDIDITKLENYYEVIYEIKSLIEKGVKHNEICVLYRMNMSGNFIEPRLISENIPYKVIGSVPFFERAEIKLLINYLRLYVDFNDNLAFKKIINMPKRKFGEKALEKLENLSKKPSLFESLKDNLDSFKNIEIKEFIELYTTTQDKFALFLNKLASLEVHNLFDNPKSRAENCSVFFDIIKRECGFNADIAKLTNFLNKIILQEQIIKENNNAINLMTIHASKGLEFEYVFLIDCDGGKMPCTFMGIFDIEEERRLAYVAMTRAKHKFYLQYDYTNPSIFVNEIMYKNTSNTTINNSTNEFKVGNAVNHKLFGSGKILAIEGNLISVNFQGKIRKLNKDFLSLA